MNWIMKKVMGLPLLVSFLNIIFILYTPEVFFLPRILMPIVIFNIIICIDILIRPISVKKDEYKKSVLILSFLVMPLLVGFPYLEYRLLTSQFLSLSAEFAMTLIGFGLLVIGGLFVILSRVQLGQYGGPKIVIEEQHQLITSGMYRYIRHPQYLGFLLVFFGYTFSLGSFLATAVSLTGLFIIFRDRMELEEKLLIATFGAKYRDYLSRTKRLIPFIY